MPRQDVALPPDLEKKAVDVTKPSVNGSSNRFLKRLFKASGA